MNDKTVAVFGGALGSLLLLLRKLAAYYLFLASLLGVIVTMTHTLGVVGSTSTKDGWGPGMDRVDMELPL